MERLRIVLAADHAVVRAGLKALIDVHPDMTVIGEARDGVEVLEVVQTCRPDVVVMDLSMPRLGGAEATRQLRASAPQIPVLVLSVHEDVTYLRRALEVGATGYVLKQTAAESLIMAIRQVASGAIYLDPALGDLPVHTLLGNRARAASEPGPLSEREETVLRLIGQGYSNKEIAAQLSLSVKTVETYKARAMEKLGMNSRVEIVRYAAAVGWLNQQL